MVSVKSKRNDNGLLRRRKRGSCNFEQFGLLILTCIFVGYLVYSVYVSAKHVATKHNDMIRKSDQQQYFAAVDSHSSLHLDRPEAAENTDFMDVEAADIRKQLNCEELLDNHKAGILHGAFIYGAPNEDEAESSQKDKEGNQDEQENNRLEDISPGDTPVMEKPERRRLSLENVPNSVMDDDALDSMDEGALVTAAHLFCLAAYGQDDDIVAFWKDKVRCPVSDKDTHMSLLEFWSSARSEILDVAVLAKTLSISTEQSVSLAGKILNVWAPPGDDGTAFMVDRLQQEIDSNVGIGNLHENLGRDRLFVDVGSGLGFTAMTVSILYPETTIVSIEAAPTNWLLQELNWRCNDLDRPKAVLKEGVAPSTMTSQVAHFIWRPTSTSSTRAWSLNMEEEFKDSYHDEDFEFSVQLLPWHKLLVRAEIVDQYVKTYLLCMVAKLTHYTAPSMS